MTGKSYVAVLIITALSLLAAWFAYDAFIRYAVVHWDEAVFLLWAYKMYGALRTVNIPLLWDLTRQQFFYPPLQSWIVAGALLPFGFSVTNARIISLFWFVLSALLLYMLAAMTTKKNRTVIGCISVGLFLMSPYLLYLASVGLKEMMCIAITIALYLAYFRVRSGKNQVRYLVVSVLLIMLFMTKYQPMVIPAAAIGLDGLWRFITEKQKSTIVRSYLILFVPFLAWMAVWIFMPTHSPYDFYRYMTNNAVNSSPPFTDLFHYLSFYPMQIFYGYSASPIVGATLLSSVILSLLYLRNARIRVLWLTFIINLILITLHTENLHARYLATTMPLLFIVTAYTVTDYAGRLRPVLRSRWIALPVILVIAVVSGKVIFDVAHIRQYTYSELTRRSIVFNLLDYNDDWTMFDRSKLPKALPWQAKENPDDVAEFITAHVDLTKPVWVLGASSEFSPDYFNLMFSLARDRHAYTPSVYPDYVVGLRILPGSRLYNRDFRMTNEFRQNDVAAAAADPTLKELFRKTFTELGVTVTIYTHG